VYSPPPQKLNPTETPGKEKPSQRIPNRANPINKNLPTHKMDLTPNANNPPKFPKSKNIDPPKVNHQKLLYSSKFLLV